jgi:hypothetical protein
MNQPAWHSTKYNSIVGRRCGCRSMSCERVCMIGSGTYDAFQLFAGLAVGLSAWQR